MFRQFLFFIISTVLNIATSCSCQLGFLSQFAYLNRCLQYSQEENIAYKSKDNLTEDLHCVMFILEF